MYAPCSLWRSSCADSRVAHRTHPTRRSHPGHLPQSTSTARYRGRRSWHRRCDVPHQRRHYSNMREALDQLLHRPAHPSGLVRLTLLLPVRQLLTATALVQGASIRRTLLRPRRLPRSLLWIEIGPWCLLVWLSAVFAILAGPMLAPRLHRRQKVWSESTECVSLLHHRKAES